jgi:hypothetical protein
LSVGATIVVAFSRFHTPRNWDHHYLAIMTRDRASLSDGLQGARTRARYHPAGSLSLPSSQSILGAWQCGHRLASARVHAPALSVPYGCAWARWRSLAWVLLWEAFEYIYRRQFTLGDLCLRDTLDTGTRVSLGMLSWAPPPASVNHRIALSAMHPCNCCLTCLADMPGL